MDKWSAVGGPDGTRDGLNLCSWFYRKPDHHCHLDGHFRCCLRWSSCRRWPGSRSNCPSIPEKKRRKKWVNVMWDYRFLVENNVSVHLIFRLSSQAINLCFCCCSTLGKNLVGMDEKINMKEKLSSRHFCFDRWSTFQTNKNFPQKISTSHQLKLFHGDQ